MKMNAKEKKNYHAKRKKHFSYYASFSQTVNVLCNKNEITIYFHSPAWGIVHNKGKWSPDCCFSRPKSLSVYLHAYNRIITDLKLFCIFFFWWNSQHLIMLQSKIIFYFIAINDALLTSAIFIRNCITAANCIARGNKETKDT